MTIKKAFTTEESRKLAGFRSTYMVDYLCRTGVLVPSVSRSRARGKKRFYSFSDIIYLRILRKLLESGVSVQKLKNALNSLPRRHRQFSEDNLPRKYLVTDGKDVYLVDGLEGVENLNQVGQFEFSFVVNMKLTSEEIINIPEAHVG